ncbi:MAG: PEP-CTERM sorting domain-containing protein [bacterium]
MLFLSRKTNRLLVISVLAVVFLSCGLMRETAAYTLFSDDFESGLDLATKWKTETIAGATWVLAGDASNKFITAQPHMGAGDRHLDIVTQKNDFSDFTFNWSMQFKNQGWHVDIRHVCFRCGDLSPIEAHSGYYLIIQAQNVFTNHSHIRLMNYRQTGPNYNLVSMDLGPNYFELSKWYNFELEAIGNSFNLKTWEQGSPYPNNWLFTAVDTSSTPFNSGRIGFGDYWGGITYVDNVRVDSPIPEPATVLLFTCAIVGLGVWRRKIRVEPKFMI